MGNKGLHNTLEAARSFKSKLGCKYLNEYYLKENGCSMIIASIELIFIRKGLLQNDGWVELTKGNVVTVNGLDAYALPKTIKRFKYARPK